MPDNKKFEESLVRMQKGREMIGRGIMEGLLRPGQFGPVILGAYNQTDGGYWQSDGDTHTQGSGDYHQS